jgi:hypothetical protein
MTVEEFAANRTARLSDSGQFDSIFALMKESLRIYFRHYPTFFAIYAAAVLPVSLLLLFNAGDELNRVAIFLTLLTGLVAFSAVAVATSDVVLGNRPSVVRSYRRALGRRGLAVLVNSIISCVVILLPMLVGWGLIYLVLLKLDAYLARLGEKALYFLFGAATPAILMNTVMMALLFMYVPIISALEMRVSSWRAIRRSVSLGRHHRMRGVAIIAAGIVALLLVASLANVLLPTVMRLLQPADATRPLIVKASRVVVGLLVTPAIYIAAVLLYFDLRSRKDGYGFAELAEDIH